MNKQIRIYIYIYIYASSRTAGSCRAPRRASRGRSPSTPSTPMRAAASGWCSRARARLLSIIHCL